MHRYVVTLGALACIEASPFAAPGSRCFAVLAVENGRFRVTVGNESSGAACDRIVIPPGIRHSVADSTCDVLRLLVEPGGNVGRRLRYALSSEASGTPSGMIDTARRLVEPPQWAAARRGTWQAVVRDMFVRVDRPTVPLSADVALLQRLAAIVDRGLPGPADATTLAARLGVAPDEVSRALSTQLGLPLRPFIRWYRLLRYARSGARGASPQSSARAAGFGGWTKMIEFVTHTFGLGERELVATERWSAAADAIV